MPSRNSGVISWAKRTASSSLVCSWSSRASFRRFGLQVVVDDTLPVGMLQGKAYLAGNGQYPLRVLRSMGVNRAAFDQLHHNKG